MGVAGRWEWRPQTIKGGKHCSESGLLRGTCSSTELRGDVRAGGALVMDECFAVGHRCAKAVVIRYAVAAEADYRMEGAG